VTIRQTCISTQDVRGTYSYILFHVIPMCCFKYSPVQHILPVLVDKVNQQVCLNCLTIDSPECIADVTESSTAEQCLEKVESAELASFDQHGRCKVYASPNCTDMYTAHPTNPSVYNSWVASPTCATSEYSVP